MIRTLSVFVTLAWSLWFGGMVALLLFVITLFGRDRSVAVEAAPMLFRAFERYQLVVGAAAVVLAVTWWAATRGKVVAIAAALMALALGGAVLSTTLITARMEALRVQGQRESEEFHRLHKRSEKVYSAQALLLLGAGVMLPLVSSGKRRSTSTSDAP